MKEISINLSLKIMVRLFLNELQIFYYPEHYVFFLKIWYNKRVTLLENKNGSVKTSSSSAKG